MTRQTIESGLFDELAPDGPYAKELLVASSTAAGLRYVSIGEDGEKIVFLGHPDLDYVLAAARSIEVGWGDTPDEVSAEDVEYRYARLLTRCPDHATEVEDCNWCRFVTPDEWWLDWSGGNEHAGAPEYMPVTVWEPEQ